MKTIVVVFLFVAAVAVSADIDFSSCARMDVPVLSKVAQGLCISSCKFQNCGTGHCEKRGGRPTCVCGRCGLGGGEWPSIPMPKGGLVSTTGYMDYTYNGYTSTPTRGTEQTSTHPPNVVSLTHVTPLPVNRA